MHRAQEQVRDFHRACGLLRPRGPHISDWEDFREEGVRYKLMKEELQEFLDAANDGDVLEMIDALCDLLYVTYGAAVSMGIDLEPFFEEVQRANMEKAGGPQREDGKQLKPEGWVPPNHLSVFMQVYNRYSLRGLTRGVKR